MTNQTKREKFEAELFAELREHKLHNTIYEEGDHYSLIDSLTPPKGSIDIGIEELKAIVSIAGSIWQARAALDGGAVSLDLPRITEPSTGLIHFQAAFGDDLVTMCGKTDWLGEKNGKPTKKAITCRACERLERHINAALRAPQQPSSERDLALIRATPPIAATSRGEEG